VLTAIIVAKNEEERIEDCLKSLLWTDRILVLDNGSTDNTAEVCRRYTRWVVPHELPPEIDPVHGNLNYGFNLIPEGWILQIDADERVSKKLSQEIQSVLGQSTHAGYRIPFRTSILGHWMRSGYWGCETKLIRLFRAGRAQYAMRSIHESVAVQGEVGVLRNAIYHIPFPSVEEFVTKTNRYTSRETDLILHQGSPGVSGQGLRAAHPSGIRLLWSAIRLFLWSLIKKRGWREGRIGVATSMMFAVYGFLEVLKVWEEAEGRKGTIPLPEEDDG
jgi:hypothetical protein